MSDRPESLARDAFHALERERVSFTEHDAATLRDQLAIAAIAAPTGAEGGRAGWVAQRFRSLGFAPRVDEAGNVIARIGVGPRAAPVVVCAHLDHVFPAGTPLDMRHEGDRIVGPGIGDNSRGLVAMLELARALSGASAAPDRPVEFVASVGEEGAGDLKGARHYLAGAAERPAAFIALDSPGDERIVNTALGSRRFRIEYRGPGGHSWSAYGTANPVHAAARAATALADLALPRGARSSLTVGRIGGGLSVNSIPDSAWLDVDARSTSEGALTRLERDIREIAAAAAATENDQRVPGTASLTVCIEPIGVRPGGETAADAPLVAVAIAATKLIGREPVLAAASTDANAAAALGIAAIAIGAGGRGGDTHTAHEWYENDRAPAGIERALTIVATMARGVTG